MTWPTCFRSITKASFLLVHKSRYDFIQSQWSNNVLVYPVWSSLCSIYCISMVLYSGPATGYGIKILIWLTYWSFYCLTLRFVLTSCNCWFYLLRKNSVQSTSDSATRNFKEKPDHQKPDENENCENGMGFDHLGPEDQLRMDPQAMSESNLPRTQFPGGLTNDLPVSFSCQWLFQNISNVTSLLVTVLFWALVYTGKPQYYISINSHIMNTLLIIVDILFSRAPCRIQHLHTTLVFLGTYIGFTVIYWLGGGTNHRDEPYIYSVLDYSNKPITAIIAIVAIAFIAVPLAQVFVYGLYRLRIGLHFWITKRKVSLHEQREKIHLMDIVATDNTADQVNGIVKMTEYQSDTTGKNQD